MSMKINSHSNNRIGESPHTELYHRETNTFQWMHNVSYDLAASNSTNEVKISDDNHSRIQKYNSNDYDTISETSTDYDKPGQSYTTNVTQTAPSNFSPIYSNPYSQFKATQDNMDIGGSCKLSVVYDSPLMPVKTWKQPVNMEEENKVAPQAYEIPVKKS